MKLINKTNTLAVFMAAAMLAVPAAAEENKRGFYIAPEIGQVKLRDYCSDARKLATVSSCKDSKVGFGLSGGCRFNDYLAVEGGGRFANGLDIRFSNDARIETDVRTFNLGPRVEFPLGEHFALTGKAGVYFWKVKGKVSGGSTTAKFDGNGTDPYLGAGIKFNFNENIGIRAEYTRYKATTITSMFSVPARFLIFKRLFS